MLNIVTK